jgi:Zinc carboxypeptidase
VAAPVSPVPYDHWPRYAELTELLHSWADRRPELIAIVSIGTSHEGRDIWICEITDRSTGPAGEKPAVWIDANIHATEVTGGTAALHLVHHLITRYGEDEQVTRALSGRAFYVVPRLNPDGVELALADRPRYVRSGVRRWPLTDEQPGLHISDVDGDGRILTMRIPDETGHWTPHPEHPRLMVPRPLEGGGGPAYRLLAEGHLVRYDGDIVKVAPELAGLADHPSGRPVATSMLGWRVGNEPSSERTRLEWVVEAPDGAEVGVTVRHPRAGVARARVRCG